jgi:chromate transporter
LNLGIWFTIHTIFGETKIWEGYGIKLDIPVWETVDIFALLIGIGAFIALFKFKVNMLKVLGGSVLVGMIGYMLTT